MTDEKEPIIVGKPQRTASVKDLEVRLKGHIYTAHLTEGFPTEGCKACESLKEAIENARIRKK
jgi:hypothetical protein